MSGDNDSCDNNDFVNNSFTMDNFLSPVPSSRLNVRSPNGFGLPSPHDGDIFSSPLKAAINTALPGDDVDGLPSSPFMSEIDIRSPYPQATSRKSSSPVKSRHTPPVQEEDKENAGPSPEDLIAIDVLGHYSDASRVIEELKKTPLWIQSRKQDIEAPREGYLTYDEESHTPKSYHSPRKGGRSPLKSSRSNDVTLRENEGLTLAMRDMEFASLSKPHAEVDVLDTEDNNIDDTCFSTFSAVPDMTLRARIGRSMGTEDMNQTPHACAFSTPMTSRPRGKGDSASPSPTPRHNATSSGDDTDMLMDFTEQFNAITSQIRYSPSKHSPTKSHTQPNLLQHLKAQRSPAKNTVPATPRQNNILNLLDFELPPAPTPKSVPTITIRELESMKSQYLSQISSLKATLSGREAEVTSLKSAVTDAERRVGLAQEELREEKAVREHAEKERRDWEDRGKEVESVLRSVKEEIVKSDKEKEQLEKRVTELESRVAEAEARAEGAESRANAVGEASRLDLGLETTGSTDEQVQRLVQAQLDERIESVSRELHSVYKKKHETKVATLKKSYEMRAEKKCAELQNKIDGLAARNEELQAERAATFSGQIAMNFVDTESKKELEEQKARFQEQAAQLAGLAEEMKTLREEHMRTAKDLERERVEKGELVAAVDEMLALQSENSVLVVDDMRKSISRPTGLPTAAMPESRIGRPGVPSLGRSSSKGKSRIMSNIEKMGSGRV